MTGDGKTMDVDATRRLASVVRTLRAGAGSTGALAIDFDQLAHDVECVLAIASCGGSHASSDFQSRVAPWLGVCFTPEIAVSPTERNHRFLEEALELVQSTGCTRSEAHQLVDYVFGRVVGEPRQEVGGVQVTLAALCSESTVASPARPPSRNMRVMRR